MKFKNIILILSALLLLSNISLLSAKTSEIIKIQLQIDNKIATVNGKEVVMDAPPTILNNRTFVPLKFISDAFGASVVWDSETRSVTILLDDPAFYRNVSIKQEKDINTLNEQLLAKEKTIQTLNNEIKKKENEINLLKEENTKLKKDITDLQNEIENLKKGINTDIEYKNIQIFVNGRKISASLEPFLFKGKVFAALEDICKPLGKTFKWDSSKNIFYIEDAPIEDQPPFSPPDKIGIYTNSFGYYIYVTDPINNRVLKYSTDGLYLDTIIKTTSTHTSGEKWELKKIVDLVTCRLTDVIGVADAVNNNSFVYEMTGHTHHKNGKFGNNEGEIQELWGIAMTEINETHAQALLDRKGCKISQWGPPPGGIKDPSNGLFIRDFGSKGTGDGQLMFPEGICYDKNQNIWVADTGNNRVVEFNLEGNFVQNVTDDFKEPCAIGKDFLSSQGNKLYILDRGNKTVHVFSSNLTPLKKIKLKNMKTPSSITIDCENNIWVTDVNLNKAFKYNQEGEELLVINNLLNPNEVKRNIVRVYVGKFILTINDIIKAHDSPPFVKNDFTYVPVTSISEGLGAKVTSDNQEKKLTVILGDQIVVIDQGNMIALVNGEEVTLNSAPIHNRNRLYITMEDYGKLFSVAISYNPKDLRYSAAAITFIYPK